MIGAAKMGFTRGWAVIEAENAVQALGVVPAIVRNKARAVKLCKFETAMVEMGYTKMKVL